VRYVENRCGFNICVEDVTVFYVTTYKTLSVYGHFL